MFKAIKKFRVFFLVAIFVSAIIELWVGGPLAEPASQLSASGLAGLAGVALAKLAHVI